jgi:ceramide glucosyltransferase
MSDALAHWIVPAIATFPFIYYLLAIASAWRFFSRPRRRAAEFTPPISVLKPVRGLDPECYENFASFCRQDYPDYEVLFCVSDLDDPTVQAIRQVSEEYPERNVRFVVGGSVRGSNDKVAKLIRLEKEARHTVLVLSDSDVRVEPDYLRTLVAPLADPSVGAVTCLYKEMGVRSVTTDLEAIGLVTDFYPGLLVDWQLEGVKFALGSTIALRRDTLGRIGGFEAQENRVADDLQLGRRIAAAGYRVELLPYAVSMVADYETLRELAQKRLRWAVVMRHMRPWGHLGLLFTQGLAWSLAAIAAQPVARVIVTFLAAYLALRFAVAWLIAVRGLGLRDFPRKFWLIPVWDLFAFLIWVASFARRRIRWRGAEYYLQKDVLVPVTRPGQD